MTASEGITYLDKKEYQKAYEQFDHAAGKFTLIFTKQKKDVLFYEGEALYQMGEYGKAIEIYDELIDHGESRAYSLKAYCLAQQKKLKKAIDAVSYTHLYTSEIGYGKLCVAASLYN